MPKLILKFESAIIKEYPVISSVVTVGRKPDNDLVIDHPAVSGHHCKIVLQGDTYFVEDLNSSNGTLVNDKKIIKAGIHNQDHIGIAKHTLLFVDDRPVSAKEIAEKSQQLDLANASPPQSAASSPEALDSALPQRKTFEKIGGIRILSGVVDQVEFELKENSTYVGKSDRVTIKIKGILAPEVAAMVSRRSNGYFLVAIKDGYPKVNKMAVHGERQLNEGDTIEVGGTTMQFYLKYPS